MISGMSAQLPPSPTPGGIVRFDRRSPILPWLTGVVVILLLIGSVDCGAFDYPRSVPGPIGTLLSLAPLNSSGVSKFLLGTAFNVTQCQQYYVQL